MAARPYQGLRQSEAKADRRSRSGWDRRYVGIPEYMTDYDTAEAPNISPYSDDQLALMLPGADMPMNVPLSRPESRYTIVPYASWKADGRSRPIQVPYPERTYAITPLPVRIGPPMAPVYNQVRISNQYIPPKYWQFRDYIKE